MRLMAELHHIAERGLEMLQDRDRALQERLQEGHHMFSMIEEHYPVLLDRFEEERLAQRR